MGSVFGVSRGGGWIGLRGGGMGGVDQGGARMEANRRASLSLEGLSCGDAFGETFFSRAEVRRAVEERVLAPAPWMFTDDTMMAISIAEVLREHGEIGEARLAADFAKRYDATRGYGPAMHGLLQRMGARGGEFWREEAGALFAGRGSFGNGSAMRVAPLGAYFADDLRRLVVEAERSSATTHAHPEAAAGAIGVALGAALLWRTRGEALTMKGLLEPIRELLPESAVRARIGKAMELPDWTDARAAGAMLGNGSLLRAMDTVPFALWCAGRFGDSYEEAMWQTVSAGGDMDTTCAMVGGMVVMRVGIGGIPEEWNRRREPVGPVLGSR